MVSAAPPDRPAARPSRVRLGMLALVFVTVVINYMDRANLALVAPALAREFRLSSVQLGLIFSAFGWSYALGQLPGGWLVDRFAPRLLYAVLLGLWSVATCGLGLLRGFTGLFCLRLGIGALEAPAFPVNNQVVTMWFPERERARAVSVYTSGQFVGLAFITPLLVSIQSHLGWRGVFLFTGGIGIAWGAVWYLLYRDPRDSRADPGELAAIRAGGGLADGARTAAVRLQPGNLQAILRSRNLWGVFLGHTCNAATLWFFLTWFPTYLVTYRHMNFIKLGFWAALPFIAAFVGTLVSGHGSDWLIHRGADIARARKTPMICGLFLSMSIVGANYVQSQGLIMLFLTLAFFGNGLASIGWTFISALAPAGLIGLTGGIYNFIGNSSAIFVPLVIGFLVRNGSFQAALIFMSGCALTGALSLLLLVRNIERIELPTSESSQ
jgi:ACS family D-galactonate transporter-like MFS transporter